jgi:hypothetical protein
MAKKKTFGNVEFPVNESKGSILISMRLPVSLVRSLKNLSLTPEYGGKYQVLARDILTEWVEHQAKPKRKRA